jgi:uncharacterized protein YcbK (DUF882 family)
MMSYKLGSFIRREFACKCGCGFAAFDTELIGVLQTVRDHFKRQYEKEVKCIIHSGCRCTTYNKQCGGKPESKHLHGIAADFSIVVVESNEKIKPREVYNFLDDTYDNYGIGQYAWGIHVDVRDDHARWIQ